jgi:hypothetical protein
MEKNKLFKIIIGVLWIFIYLSILIKFSGILEGKGSWGLNKEPLFTYTSATVHLNSLFFFKSYFTTLKIEGFKYSICILFSILYILNTKHSKKIFLFLMFFNLLDAIISCYLLKLNIQLYSRAFDNVDLFYRTQIAEYILIILSLLTLLFLYKSRNADHKNNI